MKLRLHLTGLKLAVFCSIVAMIACGETASVSEEGVFGEGIKNENAMDVNSVLAQLNEKDTVQATLTATVSEVCQTKGCWMTLHDTPESEELMVRFKDYGFFVPKDLAGSKVMIEGKAFVSLVSVEDLRHYAEDAGKSEEEINQITAPERTFSFEATGVKLLDN